MTNHQLINQTSGETEYFTPPAIIEGARRVMGSIDLDPASCEMANRSVNASRFYTIENDGLKRDWHGNVWVNWPFGRVQNPLWVKKMTWEYPRMEVQAITCITFAATSEEWFQPLMAFPQCYLSPRTNYHLPDGSLKRGVSKGSVVTYMGPDVDKFAVEFHSFGTIKIEYARRR